MSFDLKIHGKKGHYVLSKLQITAEYAGVHLDLHTFDGKSNDFKNCVKDAFGEIPVLETRDGMIGRSAAIQRYVGGLRSDNGLFGSSFYQRALVDQWLDYVATEFDPIRNTWIYPLEGQHGFDEKSYRHAKSDMTFHLGVINKHLLSNSFLTGETITLADIALACSFVALYQRVFSTDFIAPFGNVTRWFTTLIHQPEFQKHIGKVEFCKEEQHAHRGGDVKMEDAEGGAKKKKKKGKEGKDHKDDDGGKDKNEEKGKGKGKGKDEKEKGKDEKEKGKAEEGEGEQKGKKKKKEKKNEEGGEGGKKKEDGKKDGKKEDGKKKDGGKKEGEKGKGEEGKKDKGSKKAEKEEEGKDQEKGKKASKKEKDKEGGEKGGKGQSKKGGEKGDKGADKGADKPGDKGADKPGDTGKKEGEDGKKESKKEEKPKKQKKKKDDDDEEEEELDEEEEAKRKKKNPLDDLPPSKTMSIDATKRAFFSEKPFNPNFFKDFWTKFDPEGFSVYTITYKNDSENTVLFKTSNCVSGFIQRAEEVRKYAMGVVNVYGKNEDDNLFKINGSWIFRGTDIPAEMKSCDDFEFYAFTKVDPTNTAQQKLVETLFTGNNVGEDTILDRKYFK